MKIAKVRSLVLLILLFFALALIAYVGRGLFMQRPPKIEPKSAPKLPLPNLADTPVAPQSDTPIISEPDFAYPVLEKRVGIEFLGGSHSQKLLIRNLDAYKSFCLHEVLKQAHVDFALDKQAHGTTIIVYLPRTPHKALLDELRYYQIPYRFD
ncbi:hypothetical protein [Helicobacter bizzozeronii]|uniref:hypothetical protein n=1 Tax=Helicobacter bizzozeronii TaxID=56877 RepID=UPI001F2EE06A|nr:hypothetical protein [Helicobacter bizzozeronii]